jgi:thiosulfate/3-mercaptopyruvate sulfurtransferase
METSNNPEELVMYSRLLMLMKSAPGRSLYVALFLMTLSAAVALPLFADGPPPDPQIPSKQMMTPEALNQLLKSQKVLIFQVGPRSMFQQAHIPGAEYIGAASTPEGLEALRARVKSLPKNTVMVIYCGCCPWSRCPNIHPAYRQLRDLGYTNVRVLYIPNNFGADWVDRGYPTAKGE